MLKITDFFFLMVLILIAGCAKEPEKTDIGELIGEISGEVETERAEKCGDGIKDGWEECDFSGTHSCAENESGQVGPLTCENCKLNFLKCEGIGSCSEEKCNGNGKCIESIFNDYSLYCQCYENVEGPDCKTCKDGFHFDFDGSCINDSVCTGVGCEINNQECIIKDGHAECQCKANWTGENCDECLEPYFIEDGKCKKEYCPSNYSICEYYEKCDDSSGKPVCVCAGENQNPNDCSECLYGYAWIDYGAFCADRMTVKCEHDPEAPENSEDIIKNVTIKYSEAYGWSEPDLCEWECSEGHILYSNSCLAISLVKFDNSGVGTPLAYGFDENGNLIAEESKKIYSFSKTQKTFITEYNRSINEGIVGNDHNIYLMHDYGYSIFFKRTGETLYFSGNKNYEHKNFSLIPGSVIFGNSYLDFPELEYVNGHNYSYSAETVVDKNGKMLTVYENGTVKFNDKNWNLIWEKNFENYLFVGHPALDEDGHAYLPYKSNLTNVSPGILTIDLSDGDLLGNQISLSDNSSLKNIPAISIRNSSIKYVVFNGALLVFDQDNSLIINKPLTKTTYGTVDFPPILMDDGKIYFFQDNIVFCLNGLGETIWSRETEFPIREMLHHNGILYVIDPSGVYLYSAPGNLSGDWPHFRHDSRLSNSMINNEFTDPPVEPVCILPENNTVFNTSSVAFSWETYPENIGIEYEYTLVLKNTTLLETVYVESEPGLNSKTVEGLKKGIYEWRVVSKDENGSLNVSEARTFTIE